MKKLLTLTSLIILVGCAPAEDDKTEEIQVKGDYFANETIGVNFFVPESVKFEEGGIGTSDFLTLTITHEDVENLAEGGLYSRNMAESVMEALEKGEKGPGLDFEEEASEQVVSLGELNAREGIVFGRFEVCDVTFERILVFYPEHEGKIYQVVVNLKADKDKMMETFPDYFHTDTDNCGEELVWIQQAETGENMRIFSKFHHYEILGNSNPLIIEWYQMFEAIKQGIEVN